MQYTIPSEDLVPNLALPPSGKGAGAGPGAHHSLPPKEFLGSCSLQL